MQIGLPDLRSGAVLIPALKLEESSDVYSLHSNPRLMVAIGVSPRSQSLLRAAKQCVSVSGGQWLAVCVDTPNTLSPQEKQFRAENLMLARQLGAEVVLASGTHVGRTLLRVAQERQVSHLLVGKTPITHKFKLWRRMPLGDWLHHNSGDIAIILLSTREIDTLKERPVLGAFPESKESLTRDFLGAGAVAGTATLVSLLIEPFVGYWSVALVYLLGVTVAGVSLKRSPTLVLATLSGLLWNWLFIPPKFTFYISRPEDLMMFAMFFVVALSVGHLTARLFHREQMEKRLELRASALYQLTRQLAAATTTQEVVDAVILQIKKAFNLDASVFLCDTAGKLVLAPSRSTEWVPDNASIALIKKAFENTSPAAGTFESSFGTSCMCLPLVMSERVEGVLAVHLEGGGIIDPSQRELLDAFASQLAIVTEVQRLALEERRTSLILESERLQKMLFDSVSHELKTPIAAIRVALEQASPDIEEIKRANDRLHRSVEHLLSATRLESGLIKPSAEWCEPTELVNAAIELTNADGKIRVQCADCLPLMRVDVGLGTQSLATLLENALVHGGTNPQPLVSVFSNGDEICFDVSDSGPGIPSGAEEQIFDKFYRLPGSVPGGLGLGLSIARSFAEVQGGSIQCIRTQKNGAVFRLRLPLGGEAQFPE